MITNQLLYQLSYTSMAFQPEPMIPHFLPNVNTLLPNVSQTADMVCALYPYITLCIFAQFLAFSSQAVSLDYGGSDAVK